eukprot:CAMPEP_0184695156 /NCGR_PEP_ID=MMETSP0313-20130426/2877_1 /TAXON_ID=2792 /ORGANISM="Porphyridium aerugineum, Strain SAG 1380-2" /LENGTH=282 /DNA_ID=CAMNT_0027153561 /DNA_START=661 /DNA_END=1509 /DNA_ORIENTATION=-
MGIFDACLGGGGSPGIREAATVSQLGVTHEGGGVPNQDMAMIISPQDENHLFAIGVFDGHGDDGHEISALAAKIIKKELETLDSAGEKDLKTLVEKAFQVTNDAIDSSPWSKTSGCTGSLAVVRGKDFACGNVGDSTIVVMSHKQGNYYPKWTSTDHRLDNNAEKARIIENGGIIYEDQYVVDKVEKNKGLMVTRTMGDVDMRPNGVICTPDVKTLQLSEQDAYVVVASDGLWDEDGMSFQYACNVAAKVGKKGSQQVAKALLKAVSGDGPMDDCTVVALSI